MNRNSWHFSGIDKLIAIRRERFRDFAKFRRYYFPHFHKVPDALFHGELAAILNKITTARNSKIALAAPRGSAKSTLISLEYTIYCICYRTEEFIVLISSTSEHAAEALLNLKHELETNERLRKDFPEVCEIDSKPEPKRWSSHEIITKNNVKVCALGVGQNIRGKRHDQHRPSLVILDDIEGNDMVLNEDSRNKPRDWFEKSVLKVGDARTNFIFAGTIHHYGSLLAQYTNPQQAPGWNGRIYRSVITWSEAANEWQEWAAIFRGTRDYERNGGPDAARAYFEAHQEKMLARTAVLWPESRSYYDLMVLREESQLSFDSELQNEPINPRDCFFNIEHIQYWDDKFADEEALIKALPHAVIYAACDPSLGRSTTHGDFSAFITGLWDYENRILYVLDVDMERRKPENLVETIVSYHKIRDIYKLVFESNGFQELLIGQIEKRAREERASLCMEPVENRKDKIPRIQALEPFIKTGQIQLRRKHRALVEQLKYFPKGQHDDGPDALEMLFKIASNHCDWAAYFGGPVRFLRSSMSDQNNPANSGQRGWVDPNNPVNWGLLRRR